MFAKRSVWKIGKNTSILQLFKKKQIKNRAKLKQEFPRMKLSKKCLNISKLTVIKMLNILRVVRYAANIFPGLTYAEFPSVHI